MRGLCRYARADGSCDAPARPSATCTRSRRSRIPGTLRCGTDPTTGARSGLSLPRRRQSARGRCQLHADLGRPQPEPDDLGERTAGRCRSRPAHEHRRRAPRRPRRRAPRGHVGDVQGRPVRRLHLAHLPAEPDPLAPRSRWRSPPLGDFPVAPSAGASRCCSGSLRARAGINEFYKTFLREEDQDKYSIPMQLSVRGKVVTDRRNGCWPASGTRSACSAWCSSSTQSGSRAPAGVVVVLVVGSLGGWISAFGGAWKDAPVEGFQPFKFVRSPLVALGYAVLLAALTPIPCTPPWAPSGTRSPLWRRTRRSSSPTPRGKFVGKVVQHPELAGTALPLRAALCCDLDRDRRHVRRGARPSRVTDAAFCSLRAHELWIQFVSVCSVRRGSRPRRSIAPANASRRRGRRDRRRAIHGRAAEDSPPTTDPRVHDSYDGAPRRRRHRCRLQPPAERAPRQVDDRRARSRQARAVREAVHRERGRGEPAPRPTARNRARS